MSNRSRKKTAASKRLAEITVQKKAQAYLEQYYRIKRGQSHFYSNIEERTKKEYGMKRADGLLVYKRNSKRAYVVSMEAKSYKTLPALRPYRVNKIWIKDSMWKGLLLTVVTGSLFLVWRGDGWVMRLLVPFVVWLIGTLVHLFLFRNSYKYQEMAVIHQVFQYPANEQWLSLSEDSFDMIQEDLRQNLFKICKARDIGVLMVDADLMVNLIHEPKARRRWGPYGYLTYYHNERAIRDHLGIKRRKGNDKKKKRKTKRKKR